MGTPHNDHAPTPAAAPAPRESARANGIVVVAAQSAPAGVLDTAPDLPTELDAALEVVAARLEAESASPRDVLQLRIFVTDLAAYTRERERTSATFAARLGDRPPTTLIEVAGLPGNAAVAVEALAAQRSAAAPAAGASAADAVIRLRLAPGDARYAGGLAAGSKAMEIFADLETELSLREGGDEGLCAAYDMVEFLAPLHVGDFLEGRGRVVARGRTSRRVYLELHRMLHVDEAGRGSVDDPPVLAARASATIVVGRGAGPETAAGG